MTWAVGKAWGWVGIVPVLLWACSSSTIDDDTTGSAGAAAQSNETPDEQAGGTGAGARPGRDDDDVGGIGGTRDDGPTPAELEAVVAAAEQDLDEEDVETDGDLLAGSSFELTGSLCPTEMWFEEYAELAPPESLASLHVRAAGDGELEAVVSTRAGGQLAVAVVPMARASLGFTLRHLPTCAHLGYQIENSYRTERYVAKVVHVVFVRSAPGAPLQAVLAASNDDSETVVSWAQVDLSPPQAILIDVDGIASIDEVNNYGFKRTFAFSEPLVESSEVVVSARSFPRSVVEYLTDDGYLVGFEVEDVLSTSSQVHSTLTDLAGNEVIDHRPYPGVTLEPLSDGNFETPPDFLSDDDWNDGVAAYECVIRVGESSEDPFDFIDLPALQGERSLLLGIDFPWDSCTIYFRVARPAQATMLRFDARAIHDAFEQYPEVGQVRLQVSSLDAGGDDFSVIAEPTWVDDASASTASWTVSVTQTVSLPLPTEGDDLLIGLTADRNLWMDSLRLE